jgi:hypothetical protein
MIAFKFLARTMTYALAHRITGDCMPTTISPLPPPPEALKLKKILCRHKIFYVIYASAYITGIG